MAGFVKIDTDIVRSSLWIGRDLRSLFITALVMAEPYEVLEPTPQIAVRTLDETGFIVPPGWYGMVRAAGVGIMRMDGIDAEAGYPILEQLGAPDPDSRSDEHGGRRLVRVDGGYLVLNYFKYRDRDYTAAERMRRMRARKKKEPVTRNGADVTRNVTQADSREQSAKAEAEKINNNTHTALRDFCDRLSDDASGLVYTLGQEQKNSDAWAASMVAMLDGMNGHAVTPAQLAVALTELAATDAKPTPANVRAFLRRVKSDAAKEVTAGVDPSDGIGQFLARHST